MNDPTLPLSYARIDLTALAGNVRALKQHIGPSVELMAVVKANAYGHGATPVAQTALQHGASRLAVARTDEGVELRQAGITAPILVMGYELPARAEILVSHQLTTTVNTLEMAEALNARAVALGVKATVHLKIDTGLSRFGLMPDEAPSFAARLSSMPGLDIEGAFTHFSEADSSDPAYTRQQLATFLDTLAAMTGMGVRLRWRHAANSAAVLDLPETHLDAVRPGIALYGLNPGATQPPAVPLRPVLSLHSRVARVRELSPGVGVSYGRTFITHQPTLAALVPIGYGDGYHRLLSNRGAVLIRGQRARILGRVCMDNIIVDASDIPGVRQDDEVVLIGRQGAETLSADDVAAWAQTIHYEITTGLLPRLPRVYVGSRESGVAKPKAGSGC